MSSGRTAYAYNLGPVHLYGPNYFSGQSTYVILPELDRNKIIKKTKKSPSCFSTSRVLSILCPPLSFSIPLFISFPPLTCLATDLSYCSSQYQYPSSPQITEGERKRWSKRGVGYRGRPGEETQVHHAHTHRHA